LYSCTEQLRLLRALLLREEGETLWIGQGIPRAWLAPGKHVAINAAPTTFGEVSCRIEALADGAMSITLDPPTRGDAKMIRLCLRQPGGIKIASVTADDPAEISWADQTIALAHPRGRVKLHVEFHTVSGR
jgi:hypothetical protein